MAHSTRAAVSGRYPVRPTRRAGSGRAVPARFFSAEGGQALPAIFRPDNTVTGLLQVEPPSAHQLDLCRPAPRRPSASSCRCMECAARLKLTWANRVGAMIRRMQITRVALYSPSQQFYHYLCSTKPTQNYHAGLAPLLVLETAVSLLANVTDESQSHPSGAEQPHDSSVGSGRVPASRV